MSEPRIAHTADLDAVTLDAARRLLVEVFQGDFSDHDFEHALGGMHAMVWQDGALIGHASLIQRRLIYGERALRTGYVEAVGVRADHRGRGHGAALMTAVERMVRGAYDLGALSSTARAMGFYETRGWRNWSGPTSVLAASGIRRTPDDDGSVHVLEASGVLDVTQGLTCDWREGSVW